MRGRNLVLVWFVFVIFTYFGASTTSDAAEVYHLTGFRSAEFGMTEAQVQKAIEKDFNVGSKEVIRGDNPGEKTSYLDVPVMNLLPSGGEAHVSYIFGYQTHKLIQINVGWGAAAGTDGVPATLKTLAEAANQLRVYLLGVGYRPDSIMANRRMPDGRIVVFRGLDADNRGAALLLTGGAPEKPAEAKAPDIKAELPKPGLELSYIVDIKNPDVFHAPSAGPDKATPSKP
ncbi:MAG: hypothetical protein WCK65_12885 [Rhodospirillaceae bacterium]